MKQMTKNPLHQQIRVNRSPNHGEFLEASQFPAGREPRALAAGDFNGDGNIDLIVPDFNCANTGHCYFGEVSVLLGDGKGGFTLSGQFQTTQEPEQAVVGDFNGDGKLDVAIVSNQQAGVTIHLGNGDGTFGAAIVTPTTYPPEQVAIGDFNRDGKLDIAFTYYVGKEELSYVSVLLGNNNGTFQQGGSFLTARDAEGLAEGDLNGDGNPDLVVLSRCADDVQCMHGGAASVLLGNGNGTFQRHVDYSLGTVNSGIAIADFNNDGKPDVVVGMICGGLKCQDGLVRGGFLGLLVGNGDGTLHHATYQNAGDVVCGLSSSDVNHDGNMDVIFSSCENDVGVVFGNGDGTFGDVKLYGGGLDSGYGDPLVIDLNNDGYPDIAMSNYEQDSVSILLNKEDGTFRTRRDSIGAFLVNGVAVADLNGDGVPDLAEVTSYGTVVQLANGDGTFGPAHHIRSGNNTFGIAVGDFNNDGKPDLASVIDCTGNFCSSPGKLIISLGNGDGTFKSIEKYTFGYEDGVVATGDFNRDGNLDLVVAGFQNHLGGPGLYVFLGNGNGSFKSPVFYPVNNGYLSEFAVGDFNADKKLDIAVATANGVAVLLGNGDGTFQPPLVSPGPACDGVAAADFNGDGKLDLAVIGLFSNQVGVFFGNGDGTFGPPAYYGRVVLARQILAGDVNGDGKPDLEVASGGATVFLNNGDGTFGKGYVYPGGGGETIGLGDFNRDGRMDIVLPSVEFSAATLLNTGHVPGLPPDR
jgi:hypothetical protein